MFNLIVTVADGSSAHIYRVGPETAAGARARTRLVEIKQLSNPQNRQRDSEIWTEPRPGLRRSDASSGPGHAVDDRRQSHAEDTLRRFAAAIVDAVDAVARETGVTRAVFAAGPSMLGHLRPQLERFGDRVEVTEVPKELTKLPLPALRERLEADGVTTAQ